MPESLARPATIAQDAELLGPWATAFEAVCREPVGLTSLDPADPAGGSRMTFPPVFDPIELIGGIGHFQQRPAIVAHVRRLGFDWDENGRVMSVPAAGAFNARVARLGDGEAGFRMAYADSMAAAMPLGPWLRSYMEGVITVLVNTPEFYRALSANQGMQHSARWGLMSLAHDLSVHALNYHLVPRAGIVDLANRIRAAVPERYETWSAPEAVAPLTLTYFYDNDFNRYTYGVWCRCERPEDFAELFLAKRNYDQLVAALEVRLDETRAGRGDVASADFNDMGRVAETSFEVR